MQIKINNLTHTYAPKTRTEFTAIKDINLTISEGEFIAVIGQTGCGKSTLIEHLNALLLPSRGSIEWKWINSKYDKKTKKYISYDDHLELKASWFIEKRLKNGSTTQVLKIKKLRRVKRAKQLRKHVAIAFQFAEYQLFEETIEKDIMFGPLSFGVDKEEAKLRAKKYLNLCGLDDSYLKKSPFGLSGGQKRRVALAGILAIEPDIIVADEPTAGLDPVGVQEILSIFKTLHELGKTVVIVTHDLDNVLQIAQRVIVMNAGQIVKDDSTYKALKDAKFLQDNKLQAPKLLDFVSKLEQKGWKVPQVQTIDELADYISSRINQQGGE